MSSLVYSLFFLFVYIPSLCGGRWGLASSSTRLTAANSFASPTTPTPCTPTTRCVRACCVAPQQATFTHACSSRKFLRQIYSEILFLAIVFFRSSPPSLLTYALLFSSIQGVLNVTVQRISWPPLRDGTRISNTTFNGTRWPLRYRWPPAPFLDLEGYKGPV